jgi:hypothetical protein
LIFLPIEVKQRLLDRGVEAVRTGSTASRAARKLLNYPNCAENLQPQPQGVQSMLVIGIEFPDRPRNDTHLFSNWAREYEDDRRYWDRNSGSLFQISKIQILPKWIRATNNISWYGVNDPYAGIAYADIITKAAEDPDAPTNGEWDACNYNYAVVITDDPVEWAWGGIAAMPGKFQVLKLRFASLHETGHNIMFRHSNRWQPEWSSVMEGYSTLEPSKGLSIEYGDYTVKPYSIDDSLLCS